MKLVVGGWDFVHKMSTPKLGLRKPKRDQKGQCAKINRVGQLEKDTSPAGMTPDVASLSQRQ